ncbi:hypothetical protein [Cytobacillus pseudoceanisediminis]
MLAKDNSVTSSAVSSLATEAARSLNDTEAAFSPSLEIVISLVIVLTVSSALIVIDRVAVTSLSVAVTESVVT